MATTAKADHQTGLNDEASKLPSAQLTKGDYEELLRQLYLARYFDVRLIKEKKRGRLRGTLYSSHNQEAILVGSLFGLQSEDWISPIHRDMPAFFLKDIRKDWNNDARMGMTIQEVCAQVWGKPLRPDVLAITGATRLPKQAHHPLDFHAGRNHPGGGRCCPR
ncbi:MAG: hypothetical protein R2688_02300 [Fimbriimonadaceae bacterium]